MTRNDSTSADYYATSGHMIGSATARARPTNAHVEFCRGKSRTRSASNAARRWKPTTSDALESTSSSRQRARPATLNRLRFGTTRSADHLPAPDPRVEREGRKVVWSCDPSTATRSRSTPTRPVPFERILSEVDSFFQIHRAERANPPGRHPHRDDRARTSPNAPAGARAPSTGDDLRDRYHTPHCDPRLNADQALELAFPGGRTHEGRRDEQKAVSTGRFGLNDWQG